ncbi:MAG: glycoside hydrolase family 2 protein [Spirochaetaceae bacterium]|jgi:beta-mannosidase|nr:glycoside hydrolase family 2 protein [Spirochaetaceae bacterium]
MTTQLLHKNWSFHAAGEKASLPAVVPGSVYNDLLLNKKMDDPYWRDNETAALALMEKDWVYSSSFDVKPKIFKSACIILRCEGLDTLADLTLNGKQIGSACNFHRVWEFNVKDLLKEKNNKLEVTFHSPTKFMRKADKENPARGSSECYQGFPSLRKSHCMSGWDWGPRLPDAGIWKDISLLGFEGIRIHTVDIRQTHKKNKVELDIKTLLNIKKDNINLDKYETDIVITSPTGEITTIEGRQNKAVVINNPMLWWPNGYGAQNLYTVRVSLYQKTSGGGKREIDSWERRIGLRTVTIATPFCHEVNGVKIFAMGADYIPEDSILARVTPARTRKLLEQARAANMNTIRVWGGGYYPRDDFFDSCDELGLLVWQDFMFACAHYNLTDDMEENLVNEFYDNIVRIRHHASLALFCGNNEIESIASEGNLFGWPSTAKQRSDYVKIFDYILPKLIKELAPDTFYWPSSPSSGESFGNANDPNVGDVHYWAVWHGLKPFSDYRNYTFRYCSEFGFQSFPALKTIESFTKPEDRNIFSYIMEKHQRNNSANGKILYYLSQTYLYPSSFENLVYASQLLQADAIRYGVEHFRRNRGKSMGAIYWQLNDCWPVASWASIDYFGRWKALHYYAKRFFAPLMLSCEETGMMQQDPNVNRDPSMPPPEFAFRLCVANETLENKKCLVKWALRDAAAKIIKEGSEKVAVKALSSEWLKKIDVQKLYPEFDCHEHYVSYELYSDDGSKDYISSGSVTFAPPKHFNFKKPNLSYKLQGDTIIVKSDCYTSGIEIRNRNEDLVLSDNYFDMSAGEKRVKIISGKPAGIKLRSVWDIR